MCSVSTAAISMKNEYIICTKNLIFKASKPHLAKTNPFIYPKPLENKNKKGWTG